MCSGKVLLEIKNTVENELDQVSVLLGLIIYLTSIESMCKAPYQSFNAHKRTYFVAGVYNLLEQITRIYNDKTR